MIAGGTGIFPFLDLLDFLLKKSVYETLIKRNKQEEAKSFDFLNLELGTSLNEA